LDDLKKIGYGDGDLQAAKHDKRGKFVVWCECYGHSRKEQGGPELPNNRVNTRSK
jgi:hypothetical protein